LKLKTPWLDGTTHLIISRLEFKQRAAALVLCRRKCAPRCPRYVSRERLHRGERFFAADVADGSISRIRPDGSNDRDVSTRRIRASLLSVPFVALADPQACSRGGAGAKRVVRAHTHQRQLAHSDVPRSKRSPRARG